MLLSEERVAESMINRTIAGGLYTLTQSSSDVLLSPVNFKQRVDQPLGILIIIELLLLLPLLLVLEDCK
tara:strand:+ start:219 stop:425 length:207 start_codon:yes stop_codon:yes gene_type:complete